MLLLSKAEVKNYCLNCNMICKDAYCYICGTKSTIKV